MRSLCDATNFIAAGTRHFDDDKLATSPPDADDVSVFSHCSPPQTAVARTTDCCRSQSKTRVQTQPPHAEQAPGMTDKAFAFAQRGGAIFGDLFAAVAKVRFAERSRALPLALVWRRHHGRDA